MLDTLISFPPGLIAMAFGVAVLAGFVKGAVGFAMPMIMISGLSAFLPADLALAALIVPTILTNGVQALRQGPRAALASIRRFRVFLLIGLVFLLASAQLYAFLPQQVFFALIGGPIFGFSVVQLLGWQLTIRPQHHRRAEFVIGGFAGVVGGISGVWGPPTVAFLTAIKTEKTEQMRVQGVIYGLGAVALGAAHIQSGVLSASTAPVSVAMCAPALLGMWFGQRVSGRMDARRFRHATLIVLCVASLNLIRRAVFA